MSTETIAVKIGAKTGGDLLLAGAAHLTFDLGKITFSRDELHSDVKTAKGFYNTSDRTNLTGNIRGLIRQGKLNETTPGNYALAAATKNEITAKLNG